MGRPVTGTRLIQLALPRLGETMEEARVTDWLVAPGEAFRRGDVLLEVETDKTVVEVPAMQDGVLMAQLVAQGEMVALDQPFAEVEVAGAADAPPNRAAAAAAPVRPAALQPALPDAASDRAAASPRARRMAQADGIALTDISGTGRRGRITGADVDAARQGTIAAERGLIAMRSVAAQGAAKAPVVLLHGLFDEGRGWRDLPDRLARAGHPVLIPDLPGHGASAAAASDVETATDMLADALADALPQGPVRLVGHSLGAVIATGLALRLGARVDRLVLISPAGLGARINADFLDIMGSAETSAAVGRAMRMLGAGPLSDTALQQELTRQQKQRDAVAPLVRALARNGMQQIDIAADLDRVPAPLIVIFGLADQIIDWRDCASLPGRAAIHLLRDAGHMPHALAADLVAGLIADTPEHNTKEIPR